MGQITFGRLSAAALLGVLMTAGSLTAPVAQENADVEARIQLMKDLGKAMKVLGPIFKGAVPYDAVSVREAAGAIRARSGAELTKLFPEGSLVGKTEALPTIWQDWETFTVLADDLGFYAEGLIAAAENPRDQAGAGQQGGTLGQQGGTLGQQAAPSVPRDPATLATLSPDVSFGALAKTCGTCHTDFRKDD
ncbi:MAG: cytochrome c [Rhodospirillales bacterium]